MKYVEKKLKHSKAKRVGNYATVNGSEVKIYAFIKFDFFFLYGVDDKWPNS